MKPHNRGNVHRPVTVKGIQDVVGVNHWWRLLVFEWLKLSLSCEAYFSARSSAYHELAVRSQPVWCALQGVVKALFEQNLLPRVLAGSSVGSIGEHAACFVAMSPGACACMASR